MGCPVYLNDVLLLLREGARKREKACRLLFLRYLSCKDAFSASYEL